LFIILQPWTDLPVSGFPVEPNSEWNADDQPDHESDDQADKAGDIRQVNPSEQLKEGSKPSTENSKQ
jgi:hypothetical protein